MGTPKISSLSSDGGEGGVVRVVSNFREGKPILPGASVCGDPPEGKGVRKMIRNYRRKGGGF
jgi:hypothetical protein